MENENNFVQGVNGRYNFYVIAFDTENHYVNYGQEHFDLTLAQAQEIFRKAVNENPVYINTMLGVAYVTDKPDLDRYQTGAADLLQCIGGKIRLCDDYKRSPVLSTEKFISINTLNILKNSTAEIQKQLDNTNSSKDISNQKQHNIGSQSNSLLEKLHEIQSQLKENADEKAAAQMENI